MTIAPDIHNGSERRRFAVLPVGALKPRGWLAHQLRLQASGITGPLEDSWPDVGPTSAWLGGGGGDDWERGPYYLDGLVPLAFALDDPELIAKAEKWVTSIITSQTPEGQFGPATNHDWWPRMVVMKALTQYAEATGDFRIEDFLERYFRFQLQTLHGRPLESWGRYRGAENALSIHWLYERRPQFWLKELAELVLEQTADWDGYLNEQLIRGKATRFEHFTHGPNVAMGLKTAGVASLFVSNVESASRTRSAVASLDRWHGQVHGMFSGDEWLGGRDATQGVETCQVVEAMYSFETLFSVFGESDYADRLEKLAFNLLPASSTSSMRGHQYLQQANQVSSSTGVRAWSYAGADANIFGLEPNFGCCTANLHQGWPKFLNSLWMKDGDQGFVALSYAPCVVSSTVEGYPVKFEVKGNYPYTEDIEIEILSAESTPWTMKLRIPSWATGIQSVQVNGVVMDALPDDNFLSITRSWRVGDTVTLTLPVEPRVIRRDKESISVWLGPQLMVYSPGERWEESQDAHGHPEWSASPRRSWNYGILAEGELGIASWEVGRKPVTGEMFTLEGAPVWLNVRGARIPAWLLRDDEAGPLPDSPVLDYQALERFKLYPYSAARIRVAELPQIAWGLRADLH